MPSWYYYNKNSNKIGPITAAALKALTQQGLITAETVIETEAGKSAKASNVKGLEFSQISPPPVPAPVPLPSVPAPPPQPRTVSVPLPENNIQSAIADVFNLDEDENIQYNWKKQFQEKEHEDEYNENNIVCSNCGTILFNGTQFCPKCSASTVLSVSVREHKERLREIEAQKNKQESVGFSYRFFIGLAIIIIPFLGWSIWYIGLFEVISLIFMIGILSLIIIPIIWWIKNGFQIDSTSVTQSPSTSPKLGGCGCLFIIVVGFIFLCSICNMSPEQKQRMENKDFETALFIKAQKAVETQLVAPSTAKFKRNQQIVTITRNGEPTGEYSVVGEVESKNRLGVPIQMKYVVTFITSGSGDLIIESATVVE